MDFISYESALQIVTSNLFSPKREMIPLMDSVGRILAEDLHSDRDLPPYDRVTMDGIALSHKDWQAGCRNFTIEKTIGAGDPQGILEGKNNCIEIMTGASMPLGADAIVRYEDVSISNGIASLNDIEIREKQNVHFKGSDKKQGDVVLGAGTKIGSAEMNIAAAIGTVDIPVRTLPKIAIVSTGNELVGIEETPLPHQIRKSNVLSIKAALLEWHIDGHVVHLPDNQAVIEEKIVELVKNHDVIILSGGVSKGKFDFVPDALANAGINKEFHKVKQRPGKPFWFGRNENTTVFGLPGNPVSTFMCLHVYIRQWLNQSLGLPSKTYHVKLSEGVNFKPELTYFLQASTTIDESGQVAALPVIGNGSGDFSNLIDADGFVIFPPDLTEFEKGSNFSFIPFK